MNRAEEKGQEPAFPARSAHDGMTKLEYMATQLMCANIIAGTAHGERERAAVAVSDAEQLLHVLDERENVDKHE